MSEQHQSASIQKRKLTPSFAPGFLEDHAKKMVNDPKIALVELVANCWDAGADTVKITWPIDATPDPIKIYDNGTGMTFGEFTQRWLQFKYSRVENQGNQVKFPEDNRKSQRKAFGKNGKGRHSMFCFASKYELTTWKNGELNSFLITRSSSTSNFPYDIEHLDRSPKEGHGTIISASLARKHITPKVIKDVIGSKFVTDPAFKIFVNDEVVELTELKHLTDVKLIEIPEYGVVKVSQVDSQKTSRTSRSHGIAWWVDRRLVGEPSWEDFAKEKSLDRRTIEAKRYVFVVEADTLTDDVEEDWSGFFSNKKVETIKAYVYDHIEKRLLHLMKDVHKEKKKSALKSNSIALKSLSTDARFYIGKTIDGIQEQMPTVRQEVLNNTVKVLTTLEHSRSGYDLLEQLSTLTASDLDGLNEILNNWSVREARIVLSELEKRLKLIEELELLVDNPKSNELHEIQPLFNKGLWIFGPEYESVHFTSNKSLTTVIRDLFKDNVTTPLKNPRRRPDFVVLPQASIGVYSSDAFDPVGEVNGIAKVLIVELKRGGFEVGVEEQRQGEDYAMEVRKSGKVQSSTNIVVYVLGSKVAEEAKEGVTRGNISVLVKPYTTILRQAHTRTFNLISKFKEANIDKDLFDSDIEYLVSTT